MTWSRRLATVLAAFLLANTVHTVNHFADLDQGGHPWQAWGLAALSAATAAALALRVATPAPPR